VNIGFEKCDDVFKRESVGEDIVQSGGNGTFSSKQDTSASTSTCSEEERKKHIGKEYYTNETVEITSANRVDADYACSDISGDNSNSYHWTSPRGCIAYVSSSSGDYSNFLKNYSFKGDGGNTYTGVICAATPSSTSVDWSAANFLPKCVVSNSDPVKICANTASKEKFTGQVFYCSLKTSLNVSTYGGSNSLQVTNFDPTSFALRCELKYHYTIERKLCGGLPYSKRQISCKNYN
jgi:hypothetical protein